MYVSERRQDNMLHVYSEGIGHQNSNIMNMGRKPGITAMLSDMFVC